MEPSNLALFWAAVLACSILLYVFLDGFDLGVGVLFGTTRSEAHRVRMMDTIAPFWDGNETAPGCSRRFQTSTPCSSLHSISLCCCCCSA